jgi:flagellar basal body-associated protein FliL
MGKRGVKTVTSLIILIAVICTPILAMLAAHWRVQIHKESQQQANQETNQERCEAIRLHQRQI